MKSKSAFNYIVQATAAAERASRNGIVNFDETVAWLDEVDSLPILVTPSNTRRGPSVVQERDDQFYYTAGYNSYRLGLNSFDCPYKARDPRVTFWMAGYASAKAQRATRMICEEKQQPSSAKPLTPDYNRFLFRRPVREHYDMLRHTMKGA